MIGNNLTEGQRTVYEFIVTYLEHYNRAPYIREIQEGCGISSYKGTIDRLLALEKKGFIKRSLNKHRGIDLVHQTETVGAER
ncbi:MAG: hypothetical protein JW844_04245 [Candidatus Omnitrophica bacterium]|nr:hypothetical protein [Candidatus Omnitrophota bacterium]